MRDILEDADRRVSSLLVDQEAYDHWREHKVTQRLMAELRDDLLSVVLQPVPGHEAATLAHNAATRNEFLARINHILEWKPQELISDE